MPSDNLTLKDFDQLIRDAARDGTKDTDLVKALKSNGLTVTRQAVGGYRTREGIKKLDRAEVFASQNELALRSGASAKELASQFKLDIRVVKDALKLLGLEHDATPRYMVKDLPEDDYLDASVYQSRLNSFPETHDLLEERELPNGFWRIIFRKNE